MASPFFNQSSPIGSNPWTAYTPTGSWVTNVTYTGFWRRVGDSAEIVTKVLCSGAPTNASLNMTLPSGFTIDTAKLTTTSAGFADILGEAVCVDSGVNLYPGFVVYNSTTTVLGYVFKTDGTYAFAANFSSTVPFTFGSADYVQFKFTVPIVGWS